MKKFITTTLPYANSTPHVGHCLEFIQADALARFFRLTGHEVLFNIGLDEHGLKIYQESVKQNQDCQDFVNQISVKWLEFCHIFQIRYSNFYRTTDKNHHNKVQKYWLQLLDKGDIFQKYYIGKYCTGCEEFKTESQLVFNKCELHPNTEIQEFAEQNWFLKTSKYKNEITDFIKKNPNFLKPFSKNNELLNVIESAEDLSISRKRELLPWGVIVPNDPDQTIYVWFEALLNYLFACEDTDWSKRDCTTIQLCGPDNLKFQAWIWQAILRANGYAHSDHVLVHGTILDEFGKKMSKSVGNVIDPIDQLNKYGLDAIRYYVLKGIHTYLDSNWIEKDLVELYNNDLANAYGNLIARTLHLIDQHNVEITETLNNEFAKELFQLQEKSKALWNDFEISKAIATTHEIVVFGNKYINDTKPWGKETSIEQRNETLNNLYHLIGVVAELYSPVIPDAIKKIKEALVLKKKAIIFEKKTV